MTLPENSATGWEPDKEPKDKIQAKCWNCEHIVRSSVANTHSTLLLKQPWFSYTQLRCLDEACGATTILFHDEMKDKYLAAALQYPTSVYEFLDNSEEWETIQEIRGKALKVQIPRQRDLSQRVENNIVHWGEFLQHITVDIGDFNAD